MSLTVYTALLLLLADISTGDRLDCQIPNHDNTLINGFTLNVSPKTVINGSTYTVTITGFGDATLRLQYVLYRLKDQSRICVETLPFNHYFDENNTLVKNWTMPTTRNPDDYYIFRVLITHWTATFELSRTLTADSYPGNTGLTVHPVSMWFQIIKALGLLWITSKLI